MDDGFGCSDLEKVKKLLGRVREGLESAIDKPALWENKQVFRHDLKMIEENIQNLIFLFRKLSEKSLGLQGYLKESGNKVIHLHKDNPALKNAKKTIVYYHNSDFSSLEEYIEYMRRPPISDTEAKDVDWDDFLRKLGGGNQKGAA